MGEITDRFNKTFRDSEVPGLPAAGPHDPLKSEIRSLALPIEAGIAAAALSGTDLDAAMQLVTPLLTSAQAAQAAAEDSVETLEQALYAIPQSVAGQLAQAVSTATGQAEDYRDDAAASALSASLSASGAIAANGTLYPSTTAGLAGTSEGSYFSVVGDNTNTFAILYRKVSGAAVEQSRYASKAAYEGPGGAALIGYKGRSVQARLGETVSVLDFIPTSLHDAIKNDPNNSTSLDSYFRAAAVAANAGIESGPGPGGTVYVPNGYYTVNGVGIRDTVIRGESREGTRLIARAAGSDALFMLDAMIDRDAAGTVNSSGKGWAENLTLDAMNTGRSGLRVYGGGVNPRQLNIYRAGTGLATGLPLWSTFQNIHAQYCGTGFYTFHQVPGDIGTSATFIDCWADKCAQYGFHVTQLAYSSFIDCPAQDCGNTNWYFEGDAGGVPALYSIMLINCASEGTGRPFVLRKLRDFNMLSPRLIAPGAVVDQDIIELQDSQGKIDTFSIIAALASGRFHVKLSNPSFAQGGVMLLNCTDVTTNATDGSGNNVAPYFQRVGGTQGGFPLPSKFPSFEMTNAQPANNVLFSIEDVDGFAGLIIRSATNGIELARFRRTGTPTFQTNGAIINPGTNLNPGDVSFYVDTAAQKLRFVMKDGSGNIRTVSLTPDT